MNELSGSKQDEQMEEILDLLESMEQEATQKDAIIRQKDNEIQTLQGQLNESLSLCEKLNNENKAENVQALQSDLMQTRELLQREKEKRKRADSIAEGCRDKFRQAEEEKQNALMHQKKEEIPIEKPVLYERCRNCDHRTYQKAKDQYEYQRNGLEKRYKAKTVRFDAMIAVLWWYAIVTTIFAAMRSEIFLADLAVFVGIVRNGIYQYGKWLIGAANVLAQFGDKISNESVALVVHWFSFIVVIVGAAVAVDVLMVIAGKKVLKMYRENCRDVTSVGMAVTSVASLVYFGDWIKDFVKLNLVVMLLLVHAVYVGIRVYVNGCKRARGYY